jgi:hypothetical protein
MTPACRFIAAVIAAIALALAVAAASEPARPGHDELFTPPARGFTSIEPAKHWSHGLLTGNGTMGAVVMGDPFDETIHLTHAALYLPRPTSPHYIDMASRLPEIRRLCLAGDFAAAGNLIDVIRKDYPDERDPFLCALNLRIKQQGDAGKEPNVRRRLDFTTGVAAVNFHDERDDTPIRRRTFVSRADDVIVVHAIGFGQTAESAFEPLPPKDEKERKLVAEQFKSVEHGVRDGRLYFRALFAHQNAFNPNVGYEALGRVYAGPGANILSDKSIKVDRVQQDVIVMVKIRPIKKTDRDGTNLPAMRKELDALPTDYATLLARHVKVHGDLMGRVSLSLDAPEEDRRKSSEALILKTANSPDAPRLAMIERAFAAGRYNIISSTGLNPPNLQGIWSGTWQPPWFGSFTTNGNLPCAISFLLTGNTPELMEPYFALHERMLPGFREPARDGLLAAVSAVLLALRRGVGVPLLLRLLPPHR